jgi:peroxiredoxin
MPPDAPGQGCVPVGSEAPGFVLAGASSGELSLGDYRGVSSVLLVFLRGFG